MIRAVFADFDGTVFSHYSASVPSSTIQAFRALREKGIDVFLCTGRSPCEFDGFDISALSFTGMILSNGQVILDEDGEVIYSCGIQGELKERLLSIFEEKKVSMYLSTTDSLFINQITPAVIRAQYAVNSPLPEVRIKKENFECFSEIKRPNLSTEALIAKIFKKFNKKYNIMPKRYNSTIVDNIIYNEKSHIVSIFKDLLINYDFNDFLKRYYTKDESAVRLPKYIIYILKYSLIILQYQKENIFI